MIAAAARARIGSPHRHRRTMGLAAGTRLGPYDVLSLIGSGGHGRGLSRARHPAASRRRDQGAARGSGPRPRPARPLQARSPACWRRSTIRTSRRFTVWKRSAGDAARWSWSWWRVQHSRIASLEARIPLDEALPIAKQIAEALEVGPRAGNRPSRPQAGQHQGPGGRHGEGARLRPRQGPRAGNGSRGPRAGRPRQFADRIAEPSRRRR